MLTTKAVRDLALGKIEELPAQQLHEGERLTEVAVRVDELEALVADLLATDPEFAKLSLPEQASVLELGHIFGRFARHQHFRRDDFYEFLLARQAGGLATLKAEAVAFEAAEVAKEAEPVEPVVDPKEPVVEPKEPVEPVVEPLDG